MLKATLKDLWARKIRLVTTSIAVMLGVAFMSGTLVLTATVTRSFDDMFASVFRGTDAIVRAEATVEGGFDGELRPRVDGTLVETVAAVDGVALARGDIFTNGIQIVGSDGKALGGFGAPSFGGIWANDSLNPFTLVEGEAPDAPDEAVIDAKSAEDGDLAVGDTTTIITPEPVEVTIVGIAGFGTIDSAGGASFVGMTPAAAQQLFAEPGKFDSVGVIAEDGVSQDEVRDRIRDALPGGHEALTGAELTEENQDSVRQGLTFFGYILQTFAGIALFVGTFIIANTFGIIVAQRTRELALLRAIGASRRQVLRSVLVEATVVGLLASALGLASGVALASGLKALLSVIGLDTPSGGVVVPASAVVSSFVTGTLVSVTAAWFPARRASRVPPLAAMRDVAFERTTPSKVRIALGAIVGAIGLLVLVPALGDGVEKPLPPIGIGLFLLFVSVLVLAPAFARPVARLLGAPLPRLRGTVGLLSRENATRNPRRTASTAAALTVGVALVALITVFASSASKSVSQVIDDQFTADVIIEGGGPFGGAGVSPALAAELRELPEVEAVTSIRFAPAAVGNDDSTFLMAGEGAIIQRFFEVETITGDMAGIDDAGIAVSEPYAEENALAVGDEIDVTFVEGGTQAVTVAAVYEDSPLLAGSYIVGFDTFERGVPNPTDGNVFVLGRDDVDADTLLASVERAAETYPTAKVQDVAGYKESNAAQFKMLVNIIYALLGLAVLIAVLGIMNTLLLSMHERTRELGLLRAVGMTRGQLRATVRWESVLIALLGTAVGLAFGMFGGWALSRGMRSEGLSAFSMPFGQLVTIAVIGAVFGVVAGLWPAFRASRLQILDAIATT
jgi:putative ABC transport system permease protein